MIVHVRSCYIEGYTTVAQFAGQQILLDVQGVRMTLVVRQQNTNLSVNFEP